MMKRLTLTAALFAAAGGQVLAGEPPALDNGLFAEFANFKTEVYFEVCGHSGGSEGCFGGAYMNPPFDYACGVLQGNPKTHGDTMTRAIYVLDKRTSTTDDMQLYVYERKDVIANGSDSVSATLKTTIDLGFTGGSGAHCMLAGNVDYVYAATDANASIGIVSKHNNVLERRSEGRAPATGVASIVADDRGYISLNYNDNTFYIVDPHGNPQIEGGGNYGLINQRNGWIQN